MGGMKVGQRDGRNVSQVHDKSQTNSHDGRKKRSSPKFASITDIPNAMDAQRSETPYLGTLDRDEQPDPGH